MKKCELLSPAGNMTMLKYAVMYGADAVYLAGTRFGARKFANNFNDEEIVEAVRYAHLYGVRVYVTINTLIYEREVNDFIDYVKFIYKIGVDAVLVQDFGMLNLIRQVVPDLEIHASTQMHNNGKNIINLLKELGVKRVVLDREMTLDKIRKLPDIEKEVFCHGALCVSYSGQCLLSSVILNRSGNRGECAGLCRLPYKTDHSKKHKYYLSLKDICTVNCLDKILDAGVNSLKIEGRMKSPEYVGYITSIYRKLIDSYYDGNFKKINPEEMKNMKLLFNRGFTNGYIMNTKNEDMGNRESPNHVGIHLGKYEVCKDKIKITLDEELSQGDVIRFKEDDKGITVNFLYDESQKLISHRDAHNIVYIDNFLDITHSGEVRKVSSIKLNNMINDLPKRKVKIKGYIKLEKNKKALLRVWDELNEVSLEGDIIEESINSPISEENVQKQICKTGSTVYEFASLEIDLDDNVFINIKALNILRRDVLEKLDMLRTSSERVVNFKTFNFRSHKKIQDKPILNVVVNTQEQLDAARKFKCNIFTTNHDLVGEKEVSVKYAENPKCLEYDKYLISDLGSLKLIKECDEVHTDYMLNVLNSYTVKALVCAGVSTVCLSIETDIDDLKEIVKKVDPSYLEVLIYGHVELMKMKFNPLDKLEGNYLIDRNNSWYLIKRTPNMNYLMSPDVIDRIKEVDELLSIGIKNLRMDFYDENYEDVLKILDEVSKKVR